MSETSDSIIMFESKRWSEQFKKKSQSNVANLCSSLECILDATDWHLQSRIKSR